MHMAHALSSGIYLQFMLLITLEREFKVISCRNQKETPQLANPSWFCLLSSCDPPVSFSESSSSTASGFLLGN